MEPGLIWILAGLLLLGAELALPGIFLLWVGLAAIGTGGVLLAMPLGFAATVLLFLVLLAGGIAVALWLRRPRVRPRLNTPDSGLVGRAGMLLPFTGAELRVRVGDSDWPARLPREMRVPEGAVRVRVEGVDGTTLIVRPE